MAKVLGSVPLQHEEAYKVITLTSEGGVGRLDQPTDCKLLVELHGALVKLSIGKVKMHLVRGFICL